MPCVHIKLADLPFLYFFAAEIDICSLANNCQKRLITFLKLIVIVLFYRHNCKRCKEYMRESRKFCQRGVQLFLIRGKRIKKALKAGNCGPASKTSFNIVNWLGSFVIFQGIRTREVRTPCLTLWIRTWNIKTRQHCTYFLYRTFHLVMDLKCINTE